MWYICSFGQHKVFIKPVTLLTLFEFTLFRVIQNTYVLFSNESRIPVHLEICMTSFVLILWSRGPYKNILHKM